MTPASGEGNRARAITDAGPVDGAPLPVISDKGMRERIAKARSHTAALLRKTAKFVRPAVDPIVWEHGRRNMALVEHGVLAVVLPVNSGPIDWSGLGIFAADLDEGARILDHDPGVRAGVFTYELHPIRGFPGSSLPA